MSTEMVVNVSPRETRAALLENGVLQELFVERASKLGLTGNLYKGRVSRVLPGMQAAFIDIGLERTAFLHVSDIVQPADAEDAAAAPRTENIRELVSEGGDILVQVLKDPLGTKGARLTTFITIPSRYLVYMPFGHGVGVSARIESEEERARLRAAMQSFVHARRIRRLHRAHRGRSAPASRPSGPTCCSCASSGRCCRKMRRGARDGMLVHEDLPLPLRLMRDLVGEGVDRVLVDNERICERMQEFAATFMPALGARIERYTGSRPIFDLHGVEEEIQRSLDRKVALKSGGYLIIDQTEALTTIDVNTGAYVGHRNLEETIYRTNLEAAVAIARQLRLRNLGGIIIIDFIDMEEEEHRRQVLQALEKALAKDHAKTHVSAVSPLGLVEMTRKRTRESLAHQLCAPCPACEGRGFVKTTETVCYEMFREVLRQAGQFDFQQLMVLAHSDVIERLLDEESAALGELEVLVGKPIRLQTEALYLLDQYDVVLM